MKSILISIKPEWVAKILNGYKTIEIRKTAPKCDLPVDVYIYCTKGKDLHLRHLEAQFFPATGDPIHYFWEKFEYAYFDEDELDEAKEVFLAGFSARNETDDHINGKVVAKFTLKEVKAIYDRPEGTCDSNPNVPHPNWHHYYEMGLVNEKLLYGGDENISSEEYGMLLRRHSCLSQQQIFDYLNKDKNVLYGVKGYAWFISDLEIFDEPKELSEFDYLNPSGTRYVGKRSLNGLPSKKHPPQSWLYAEKGE